MQIITNQFQKELKEHGNYFFPFLISNERLSKYEYGSFLWHWHPEIELTLITKGTMIYKVNNKVFHLQQGQALFENTASLHSGCMNQKLDCEYISITFDPKLIYGFENSSVYVKYVKPIIQNLSLPAIHFDSSEDWHGDIIHIMENIISLDQNTNAYNTYELDILIELTRFWKLLFIHSGSSSESNDNDKRNYGRIRDILTYVEVNYNSKITLGGIANHIHICKSECCRIFKRYMKISLFDFILEYRIEKSLNYLSDTKYSIKDISERVGFNDSNYFSKVFCKLKGCSPMAYRKSVIASSGDTSMQ